jgi:hypothetical protein
VNNTFHGIFLQLLLRTMADDPLSVEKTIRTLLNCGSKQSGEQKSISSENLKELIFDNCGSHLIEASPCFIARFIILINCCWYTALMLVNIEEVIIFLTYFWFARVLLLIGDVGSSSGCSLHGNISRDFNSSYAWVCTSSVSQFRSPGTCHIHTK